MSRTALQTIVGTALVDQTFCEEFLDGKRPAILAKFDLTDEERQAASSIEARSIREFAIGLCDRLVI